MSYEPDRLPPPRPLQPPREKITIPGIFLIAVGVISVLLVALGVGFTIHIMRMTDAEIEESLVQLGKSIPQLEDVFRQQIKDAGSIEAAKRQLAKQQYIQSGLSLVAAVVTVLGGIAMVKRRRHGLAVTGSILAALPILSPCICVGQIVGIWALVVLFNSDVRAAFQANTVPRDEGMLG